MCLCLGWWWKVVVLVVHHHRGILPCEWFSGWVVFAKCSKYTRRKILFSSPIYLTTPTRIIRECSLQLWESYSCMSEWLGCASDAPIHSRLGGRDDCLLVRRSARAFTRNIEQKIWKRSVRGEAKSSAGTVHQPMSSEECRERYNIKWQTERRVVKQYILVTYFSPINLSTTRRGI